ncbi:chemokine XC receptor 1-like [Scleropages formosus]|uniref:Chemokine XC receptor 1-like n=1 Tax=Scleropages formosus TaxID=113540 RepID=A0A8C9RC29_SCLFO|nr:chemokine XC receptor 1-like [Scleropages formosus]
MMHDVLIGISSMNDFQENETYNDTSDYNGSLVFLCEDENQHSGSTATAFCFIVIFCLSFAGNTVVLCVLARYEKLKRVTNLFVLNLAMSDLIFSMSLPFWSTYHFSQWVFGDFLCKLLSGAYFIGFCSSMMFLTAMTVDRYMIMVHNQFPLLKKRRLCAQVTCVAIWIISVSSSIKEMVISSAKTDKCDYITCESSTDPWMDKISNYILTLIFFLVPLTIIIYCYCRILKIVISSKNKNKHKTIILIFCIVVAFFVCLTPYNVVLVTMSELQSSSSKLYHIFIFCRILAYFHCCLNPFLYAFTEKFRAQVSRLLCCAPLQRRSISSRLSGAHSISNVIEKVIATNENIQLT